jgi:hypothetical protein
MPCVVAIKKTKPRKRKNSSHLNGSEREALVAGMRMDLMKLTGKKWTKYPRIVCKVASVFTSEGFTSLTPAFLLSSRVISPHAKNSQSSMLSSACGIFSGAGSLSSSTPKPYARKFDGSSPLKIAGTSIARTLLPNYSSHIHHIFRIDQAGIIKEVLRRPFNLNLTIADNSIEQKTIVEIDVSHHDT